MTTEANKLADEVTEKLFTNGAKQKADRLVLVKENDRDGHSRAPYRDLGGWARGPVRDLILEALSDQRETLAQKCTQEKVRIVNRMADAAYNQACEDCAAAIRGK